MTRIRRGMPVEELAAIISEALTAAGITAVLSGGSVVSIYTVNEYESADLDFVTAAAIKDLAPVMESLGFRRTDHDRQCLDQAVMVARRHDVQMDDVAE